MSEPKSEFINNPSKDELLKNQQMDSKKEDYKLNGYVVFIKDGIVYGEKKGIEQIELGTLPNLAETTKNLFGDTIPEDVEIITLDGITMMTYQGAVIDCGWLDKNFEKHYTFNIIVNDDVVGSVEDGILGNNELETKSGAGIKEISPNMKCSSSVMENGMAA